jgi:hypothetical protein
MQPGVTYSLSYRDALLSRVPSTLFALLLTVLACYGLFRTAGWFGVERRRVWRTSLRDAWWAWAICGLLGVALPLAIELMRRP